MAKKNMYTNAPVPHGDKGSAFQREAAAHPEKDPDYTSMLHRVADAIQSDYGHHAKTLRTMADHLDKSHGQPRTRESHGNQRGPGHKKVNAVLGG